MRGAPPGCSSGCAAPKPVPVKRPARGSSRGQPSSDRSCTVYAAIPETAAVPNANRLMPADGMVVQNLRGDTSLPDPDDYSEELPHAAMDLSAAPYQQTLKKSFTIKGFGLHTTQLMTIRVRPAHANDGRYFVRVPEGTNAHLVDEEETANQAMQDVAEEVDPFVREKQAAAYMRYVREQQAGYPGSFNEFLSDNGLDGDILPLVNKNELQMASEEDELDVEEIVEKTPENGGFMDASFDNALAGSPWTVMLGTEPEDPHALVGVELLLGTLEALHIDNARIEIEGGNEIPALDGSAQPWLEHIEHAGIRPALRPGAEPDDCVRKFAWKPHTPISIYDDHGAFITLYPNGLEYKLTVGVERDALCIGAQWVTLDAQQFTPPYTPFAVHHAPARNWIESQMMVDSMREAGYLRAMSSANTMIADGERWIADGSVRFEIDEPARHQMIRTLGDLALMGEFGNSGLPCGHLVVYNANHNLMHQFLRRVKECMEDGSVITWPFMLLPEEIENLQERNQQEIQRNSGEVADADAEAHRRQVRADEAVQTGLRLSTQADQVRARLEDKRSDYAQIEYQEQNSTLDSEQEAEAAELKAVLKEEIDRLSGELTQIEGDLAALDAQHADDADVHAAYDRVTARNEAKEARRRVMEGVGSDVYDFGDVSDLLEREPLQAVRDELDELDPEDAYRAAAESAGEADSDAETPVDTFEERSDGRSDSDSDFEQYQ